MINVINNFNKEILELRQHISYSDSIINLVPADSTNFKYVSSPTRKKLDYKLLIISIYGMIESYSEQFIINYFEHLTEVVPYYIDLKPKIKEAHIFNSANLASKILENKYGKYQHLKAESVMTNLNKCLLNYTNYFINSESFTILSGNLKHSKICDLFRQIDIDINQKFNDFGIFNCLNSENFFNKIDDIVVRRNVIAHGSINDILDNLTILEYIDFIEKYFNGIYKILEADIQQERLKFLIKYSCFKFENVSLFNGGIIGFKNINYLNFNELDKIIIKKSDGSLKVANIISIKKFISTNEITLKLDSETSVKKNQEFYLYSEHYINKNIFTSLK